MNQVKLQDLGRKKTSKIKESNYNSKKTKTTYSRGKSKFNFFSIFGELFRFSIVLSVVTIGGIIFVNMNLFYYTFKETFFSHEIYAGDSSFATVEDFSSFNQPEKSENNSSNIQDQDKVQDDSFSGIEDEKIRGMVEDGLSQVDSEDNIENRKNMKDILRTNFNDYSFDFNLNPPDNRIIIPSIGVDAPIVDVDYVNPQKMAEANFEEELYDGVVKYPFTPSPEDDGNMFVFGHTSYYRWRDNDYGEVFARIPRLDDGDKIKVLWGGNLYKYEVVTKAIRRPAEVGDFYEEHRDGNYITLMGCYPIGSNAQRILVMAKQLEEVESDEIVFKN
ncbi:sortase [Candidatus Absconditicoccus praedator]|uniref:sortase n=1 Tax=Candidatus Absconditicoccus praedator TaxID=2735562 RepID=UPI001E5FEDEB|nr:class E sortase [Candidatus Absconditicoccus praedator]UFX83279.1 class E sortase [Candidatus Absconditicoccus praedator]